MLSAADVWLHFSQLADRFNEGIPFSAKAATAWQRILNKFDGNLVCAYVDYLLESGTGIPDMDEFRKEMTKRKKASSAPGVRWTSDGEFELEDPNWQKVSLEARQQIAEYVAVAGLKGPKEARTWWLTVRQAAFIKFLGFKAECPKEYPSASSITLTPIREAA